jgi:hypothetical protein
MKTFGRNRNVRVGRPRLSLQPFAVFAALLGFFALRLPAQTAQPSIPVQIQQLTAAMERTQAQLKESQQQLDKMRSQLATLQQQMSRQQGVSASDLSSQSAGQTQTQSAELESIREHQAMQETQIATHDQIKVESESKYPVKITGLLLFNGFVNTSAVDMPATPTVAVPGAGSTGASVRQTVLGVDARGPHLWGARSYADLRVDFYGNSAAPVSPLGSYSTNDTLLRLKSAHAGLQWENTEAAFSFDRPLISPDSPSSLTAVAIPALAWSGNLWAWNPQLTLTQNVPFAGSHSLQMQAAMIDVGDPPISLSGLDSAAAVPPSGADLSRWPGLEARIALLGSQRDDRDHIGVGGYFSPHVLPSGRRYDAWASTLDARFHMPARLQFSGSFYRGLALGGLGAGGYKDYGYFYATGPDVYFFRPLNDVGGWTQLKEKWSERLEFNAAFGMDNVFANDLRRYANPSGTMYQRLARNRTWTGNVIYSPSAYLLFSFEYRYLTSAPITGSSSTSNVIGLSAGYKF